jgi:hypothetical protein
MPTYICPPFDDDFFGGERVRSDGCRSPRLSFAPSRRFAGTIGEFSRSGSPVVEVFDLRERSEFSAEFIGALSFPAFATARAPACDFGLHFSRFSSLRTAFAFAFPFACAATSAFGSHIRSRDFERRERRRSRGGRSGGSRSRSCASQPATVYLTHVVRIAFEALPITSRHRPRSSESVCRVQP